jgi:cytochrome c556
MERARALREAGAAVHKAAKAHDVDALFEQGGILFEACQGCHFDYRYEKDPKVIRSH